MRKILVVLTTEFPFGKSESFLESELEHYDAFDEILLCPMEIQGLGNGRIQELAKRRNISIVNCYRHESSFSKYKHIILKFLDEEFWHEFYTAIKKSEKKKASIKELLIFSSKCDALAKNTFNSLKPHIRNGDQIYIYSYWLYQQAYTAVFLKKKIHSVCMAVSRCHRFDIYEDRHFGYIPFRRFLLDNLDKIYSISEDGQNYIRNQYPRYKNKIEIARLGTNDYGVEEYKKKKGVIRIASCSYCVPVKRIELIIKALHSLSGDGVRIEWKHFGDGELLDDLKELAGSLLQDNIKWTFMGYCSNKEIIDEYQNASFDLFVNVSASEGIPVSIMEAMSFGIPVIATDVGGTKELVVDGYNGFLISPENAINELVCALRKMINLSDDDYLNLRKNAREYWIENYNAKNNYKKFMSALIEAN